MGKHYVPQAHLRRFQIDGSLGLVWMYDKKTRSFVQASVSKVAQNPDFYSQDVERVLADIVELPGNICIDKMLRHEKLNNAERTQLSFYMLTMATRGPRQRKKSLNLVSEVLKSVFGDRR